MILTKPKQGPGGDGKMEIRVVRIDDPYRRGYTQKAYKNVATTLADRLYARKQIGPAQHRASSKYQSLYDNLRVRTGTIDPAGAFTGSGKYNDPMPALIDANKDLLKANQELGLADARIMTLVAMGISTIREIALIVYPAIAWGPAIKITITTEKYIGRRFRDSLSALAGFWGYRGTIAGGSRPMQSMSSGPKAAVDQSEWEVGET